MLHELGQIRRGRGILPYWCQARRRGLTGDKKGGEVVQNTPTNVAMPNLATCSACHHLPAVEAGAQTILTFSMTSGEVGGQLAGVVDFRAAGPLSGFTTASPFGNLAGSGGPCG